MSGSEIAILLIMLAYAAIGGITLRRWRRRRRQRPVDIHDDPAAWLAFWLPPLIATQVIALVGGAMALLLIARFSPILRSANAPYFVAGAVIALIFVVILFVVIGVFFFVLPARRVQRQLRASDR
jgi:hypothetical protein